MWKPIYAEFPTFFLSLRREEGQIHHLNFKS